MNSSREEFINELHADLWILRIMISRSEIIGGGDRSRTDDPLLAKQVLSH
jgi:hypothetical protein